MNEIRNWAEKYIEAKEIAWENGSMETRTRDWTNEGRREEGARRIEEEANPMLNKGKMVDLSVRHRLEEILGKKTSFWKKDDPNTQGSNEQSNHQTTT